MEIKIAQISGQFYSKGNDNYYTYAVSKELSKDTSWKGYFFDLRRIINGIDKAYVIWHTDQEWWIGVCVKNDKHDESGGYAEIAFCLGNSRPENGREIIDFLDKAVVYFLIDKENLILAGEVVNSNSDVRKLWKDEDTKDWLEGNSPRLKTCSRFRQFAQDGGFAYRTYSTDEELGTALTQLSQSGYEKYANIFIIRKEDKNKITKAECIDDKIRIRRRLHIKNATDGVADVTEANEGDSISVTYTKTGYEPQTRRDVSVGGKRYGDIQDDVFVIKEAKDVCPPIKFYKKVSFKVTNGEDKELKDAYICIIGKNKDKNTGQKIQIYEGNKLKIQCESYEDKDILIEELKTGQTENIKLKKKKICLITMKDGKQESSLEDSIGSKKYNDFKKKGAEEQNGSLILYKYSVKFKVGDSTFNSKEEVIKGSKEYEVLKKEGAKGEEGGEGLTLEVNNKTINNSQNKEKEVNSDNFQVIFKVDGKEFNIAKMVSKGSEDYNNLRNAGAEEKGDKLILEVKNKQKRIIICTLVILAILLVFIFVFVLEPLFPKWFGKSTESITETETKPVKNEQEELENKDIIYLEKNNEWKKDSLKSDRYRLLYKFVSQGEIDSIVDTKYASSWFSDKQEKNNGFWHNIEKKDGVFDVIKNIKENTINKEEAGQIMKDCSQDGSIKLSSLKEELNKLIGKSTDKNSETQNRSQNVSSSAKTELNNTKVPRVSETNTSPEDKKNQQKTTGRKGSH
jgi:mRNA-degrading endonuclease RelE of RelBE toxin-antitoxin system